MTRGICLVALSAVLASCGAAPLRSPQAASKPVLSHRREATVIYVPEGTLDVAGATTVAEIKCTGSESGGVVPLLIPFAGLAVDSLTSAVSSLLARAKDDRTATWSATLGGVPLQASKHYCLAISRGTITDMTDGPRSAALDQSLRFDGVPAFVLFADISLTQSTAASKAVTLTVLPKFLSYADTAAPSRGKNKKDVSILLSFNGVAQVEAKSVKPTAETGGAATKPANTSDGKIKPDPSMDEADKTPTTTAPTNGVRLDFGRLEIGHVYSQALLIPTKASVSVSSGGLFALSALVTESEDPNVALSALASGFDSQKGDLTAALKKALGVPTAAKATTK